MNELSVMVKIYENFLHKASLLDAMHILCTAILVFSTVVCKIYFNIRNRLECQAEL
jgi:hypothetical protein